MEKWIDLHTHTSFSDGMLTPSELVQLAYKKGLSAIAVTDHDCVFGVKEAVNAGERLGITIIQGVELSTVHNGMTIHIVGLFINPDNAPLVNTITTAQNEVMKRNILIFDKLALMGFNDLSIADLQSTFHISTPVRWHISKYLEIKGYATSATEARAKYLGKGKEAYVESTHKELSVYEAISLIHGSGGFAFLSHPKRYKLDDIELSQMMLHYKERGLDGIEAYHFGCTDADTKGLLSFAKTNDLLISGGSDFHGSHSPDRKLGIAYGQERVPYSVLSTLLYMESSD